MGIKLKNNATSSLANNITATDTSIQVQDSVFPTLGADEYFYATLQSANDQNTFEIVKVTDVSGTTLTVERGAEGTTPKSFVAGDIFEQRVTAQTLYDLKPEEKSQKQYIGRIIGSIKNRAVFNSVSGLSGYNERRARSLVLRWDSVWGPRVKCDFINETSGVVKRNLSFNTLNDMNTFIQNNISISGGSAQDVSYFEVYNEVDSDIPVLTSIKGFNRFYGGIKTRRQYSNTTTNARYSGLSSSHWQTMYQQLFNVPSSAWGSIPNLGSAIWTPNAKSNVYGPIPLNYQVQHTNTNGGGRRWYYDTNTSSFAQLSPGEEDFEIDPLVMSRIYVLGNNPSTLYSFFTSGSEQKSIREQILNGSSAVIAYPLRGVTNGNRKSIIVKPLGIDMLLFQRPDFNKYDLEIVSFHERLQSEVKMKVISSVSDLSQYMDDPDGGKILIRISEFSSVLRDTYITSENDNFKKDFGYYSIRFRLRDKVTKKVSDYGKFELYLDNKPGYITSKFMLRGL